MSIHLTNPIRTALSRRGQWICQSCMQQRSMVTNFSARAKLRALERQGSKWKYGAKLRAGDEAWAQQVQSIRDGQQQSLWQTLKERGLVHQVAGSESELERTMIDKRINVYAGIDPTAPSMHVGHLLPIMVLLWFYVHGYGAYTLLGGATSRIGDPSGRTAPRDRQASATRKANMASMHLQINNIWDNMERYAAVKYKYRRQAVWRRGLVNNNKWWNKLPVMEFMHYAGQLARVGPLLSRDTAKRKLDEKSGLSFAELGYPIMQGWDWWELYKQLDVQLQIGGADQFGNIIAGMEVVNNIVPLVIDEAIEPEKFNQNSTRFGFTIPLLTTSSGEKIGKSAGNAIWLDHSMTSPFDLYGYFLSLTDSDAIRFLKLFTLMPLNDISDLADEHATAPSKRLAHHRLAFDVLALVHGLPTATATADQHAALFNSRIILPPRSPHIPLPSKNPSDMNLATNPNATPTTSESLWSHNIYLPRSLITNAPPARILFHAGLVGSRSEGQRLINAGGASYGGETGLSKPTPRNDDNDDDNNTTSTTTTSSSSSSSSNNGPTHHEMPDELKFVPLRNPDPSASAQMLIGGDCMILRAGKKKVRVVRILEDDEFERRALPEPPGWREWKDNNNNTARLSSQSASESASESSERW